MNTRHAICTVAALLALSAAGDALAKTDSPANTNASSLDKATPPNIAFTVNGTPSIRMAAQNGVCDAKSAGALRFTASDFGAAGRFEGCDGVHGWLPLAGNGGGVSALDVPNCQSAGMVLTGDGTRLVCVPPATHTLWAGYQPDHAPLSITDTAPGQGASTTCEAKTDAQGAPQLRMKENRDGGVWTPWRQTEIMVATGGVPVCSVSPNGLSFASGTVGRFTAW